MDYKVFLREAELNIFIYLLPTLMERTYINRSIVFSEVYIPH